MLSGIHNPRPASVFRLAELHRVQVESATRHGFFPFLLALVQHFTSIDRWGHVERTICTRWRYLVRKILKVLKVIRSRVYINTDIHNEWTNIMRMAASRTSGWGNSKKKKKKFENSAHTDTHTNTRAAPSPHDREIIVGTIHRQTTTILHQ